MSPQPNVTVTRSPAPSRRRSRRPGAGVLLLVLGVGLAAVLGLGAILARPTVAGELLVSKYSVNRGATLTAMRKVGVGDEGHSPFFSPGVVVWDGGSILGGYQVDAALKPTVQTARLLPRSVTTHLSITGGADIADMLANAPVNVDQRRVLEADANVCIVMAGGSDLKAGREVDTLFASLRQYCLERRSAGFQVVVVTLLPRSIPAGFEADRLEFNELVRTSWAEFADGLADVGADPRIGETLDDLDQRYYQADGVHPNAAGCAVMAAILAPVLSELRWRSDGCVMRLRNDGGDWTAWRSYAPRLSWSLPEGDGDKTVEAEYRNAAGTMASLSDSIRLDTHGPRTSALAPVAVRRGRVAVLRYRVDDPAPGSSSAVVSIRIKRRDGSVVKRIYLGKRAVGTAFRARFTCWLPRGTYRYVVYARDAAGNPQVRAGGAGFKVTR